MTIARFTCSSCGQPAGTVELLGPSEHRQVRRTSFTSVLTDDLDAGTFAAVAEALAAQDARALHSVDEEYAPFYCPACRASYCGDHWQRWDIFDGDWHDSIRGRCPRGHERMLED